MVAKEPPHLHAERREHDRVHQGQAAEVHHCDLLGAWVVAVPLGAAAAGDEEGGSLGRGARHTQGSEGVEAAPPPPHGWWRRLVGTLSRLGRL